MNYIITTLRDNTHLSGQIRLGADDDNCAHKLHKEDVCKHVLGVLYNLVDLVLKVNALVAVLTKLSSALGHVQISESTLQLQE